MLLDKVRKALRRTSNEFDNEINDLICAAYDDLQLAGARNTGTYSDATVVSPLMEHAIILYCKAHFGFNDDNERYIRAYEQIKCRLSLADSYENEKQGR